ncbi:MAG: tetratricopeptide repeat protein [Syntrophorhabdaceae bacterium]
MKRLIRVQKRVLCEIILISMASFFLCSCAGVSINPEVRADFNAGVMFFNQGKFPEALVYFEKAVSAEPDYYEAQLYLGRSYLNMKDYSRAVPPLRRAYRLSPDDFKSQAFDILIDALMGAAFSELGKGNFETSLTYLREVMSGDPKAKKIKDDMSNVLVAVATGLFRKGEVRESIKIFSDAIKADPNNTKAYVGLAKALIKSGSLAEAIDAAQKAMSLDPTSSETLNLVKELLR